MRILLILISSLLVVLTVPAFAFSNFGTDLLGKELFGTTSTYGSQQEIWLKFASEPNYGFNYNNAKIQQGTIQLSDGFHDLIYPDIKFYGKTFVAKSLDEPLILFAFAKDNSYTIHVYQPTTDGVSRTTFYTAIQEPIPIIEKGLAAIVPKTDLIVVTKQDYQNYWNTEYDLYVKVFDKKLNPNPNFDDFYGTVDGVALNVTLTHADGSNVQKISGITSNHGFWHGKQYFPENISKPGKYSVNLVASFLTGSTEKNQEMFLFGVTPNQFAQGNSTAP